MVFLPSGNVKHPEANFSGIAKPIENITSIICAAAASAISLHQGLTACSDSVAAARGYRGYTNKPYMYTGMWEEVLLQDTYMDCDNPSLRAFAYQLMRATNYGDSVL